MVMSASGWRARSWFRRLRVRRPVSVLRSCQPGPRWVNLAAGSASRCQLPCVHLGPANVRALPGWPAGPWLRWSGVLLLEDALEGGVLGRVISDVFLPAAPDDVDPGAGGDA